jgi:hypothetical protein
MQSNLVLIYDVVFRPRQVFQSFSRAAPWRVALGVFILSTILPSLVFLAGAQHLMLAHFMGLILFVELAGSLVFWVLGTGVYHFIAEFSGGEGRAVSLFSALGLAHLPHLAMLPLFVLAGLLSGVLQTLWLAAAACAIWGWTWILYYYAVKEIYQLSGSKTVLVLCAPFLAVLFMGMVIVVFFAVSVAQFSLENYL